MVYLIWSATKTNSPLVTSSLIFHLMSLSSISLCPFGTLYNMSLNVIKRNQIFQVGVDQSGRKQKLPCQNAIFLLMQSNIALVFWTATSIRLHLFLVCLYFLFSSVEFIQLLLTFCLWLTDVLVNSLLNCPWLLILSS